MKKNRKAQIRMMENIVIMIIFFFLIAFGFSFYTKIEIRNVEIKKQELADLKAVEIAQKVSLLPELQCSSQGVLKSDCLDVLKIEIMKTNDNEGKKITDSVINNNIGHYYDLFLDSNVTVDMVYPDETEYDGTRHWQLYYKAPENYQKKLLTKVPVSLYYIDSNNEEHYAFGLLSIEAYLK